MIAEDSVLLREGITRLLVDAGEEVVAGFGDADALLDSLAEAPADDRPELVVLDVRMPPTYTDEGVRAALQIRERWPDIGILVLSQYVEERYATELISGDGARDGAAKDRGGGVGYLLKDRVADVRDFVDALRRVGDGGTVLDPEVVTQLLARARQRDPLDRLTPRERTVLSLMAEGRSNAAIAQSLVVSDGAVEKHVSNIFTKLDLPPAPEDHRRVLAVLQVARVVTATTHGRVDATVPVPLPVPVARHRGRPAWRIVASVLTVAALLWGTLNVVNLLAHGEQHFTRTFAAEGITRVDVSTDRGSVRVIATDRDDISVHAYVSDGLGDTDHAERVRGDRLLVDASCSFPVAYWCTASYTVRVPRDVKLVLWSGSGDVTVTGATGDVDLTSNHGAISATRLRSQYARASSDHGSIHLGFAAAPMQVVASTSHGSATVVVPRTGEAYRVDLSSDHGSTDVAVRTDPTARRTIELSSQHGAVVARYAPH